MKVLLAVFGLLCLVVGIGCERSSAPAARNTAWLKAIPVPNRAAPQSNTPPLPDEVLSSTPAQIPAAPGDARRLTLDARPVFLVPLPPASFERRVLILQ